MTELQLQAVCFRRVNQDFPRLRGLVFHIENEGKRTPSQAAQAKSIGLVAGIPDLCFAVPCNGYSALYIEMKAEGKKPSKIQLKRIAQFVNAGNAVFVIDNEEDFIKTVKTYFAGSDWLKSFN